MAADLQRYPGQAGGPRVGGPDQRALSRAVLAAEDSDTALLPIVRGAVREVTGQLQGAGGPEDVKRHLLVLAPLTTAVEFAEDDR